MSDGADIRRGFAGTVAWILPNPSGLNRTFTLAALVKAYSNFPLFSEFLGRRSGASFGLEDPHRRRRKSRELLGGADGTGHELTTTVRAAPMKRRLSAVATEGALEAADPGVEGLRRQVLIAALAIRSKL
jgi:hypothetical protein